MCILYTSYLLENGHISKVIMFKKWCHSWLYDALWLSDFLQITAWIDHPWQVAQSSCVLHASPKQSKGRYLNQGRNAAKGVQNHQQLPPQSFQCLISDPQVSQLQRREYWEGTESADNQENSDKTNIGSLQEPWFLPRVIIAFLCQLRTLKCYLRKI